MGSFPSDTSIKLFYLSFGVHFFQLTSGRYLRLLRDATRLVRLSYLEFDLQKMMEEELYADFAILFRLLHATRMPKSPDHVDESFIEYYHQESLASGSRIREKLSEAVEKSIKELANGFLSHPANEELKDNIKSGRTPAADYYLHQLRLIYRFLFLIVTEERNLVYPDTREESVQKKRKIYYDFYSIERLRKLAAKLHYVDGRKHDLWEGLKATFLLFEKGFYGEKLGIKPLGSGLFSVNALGDLPNQKLDNETLLKVIRHLTLFENEQRQWVRVNYSDLDVEEFGSVYEGLLEYDAAFADINGQPRFAFVEGTSRSSSGSHYTPEELVKPLIKHSLEYIIEDKLKEANKEAALLSIKVCDVACGSGHILLSAARRIAIELARVRTNEDQPNPKDLRHAIRDVIRNCIYGVDKNPLAIELCKVALWLEAHNPGEPLHFLDHHIKCGDAIVGLAHMEELQNGIAEEAFKSLPGDDKDICSSLRKVNKAERGKQLSFDFQGAVGEKIKDIAGLYKKFSELPERTPEEIEEKRKAYLALTSGEEWYRLKTLADIQVAQFFIPKDKENQAKVITDGTYRQYLAGEKKPLGQAVAMAEAVAGQNRFFHWFLEFPEVFAPSVTPTLAKGGEGGFDCILGNPPFLGGQKLSGNYGNDYLEYIKCQHAPIGAVDLVTYFFRRIFEIIKVNGFQSLISTNTIAQGNAREDGLDVIVKQGGTINHAVKSMRWPGKAAVEVALVTITKQNWKGKFVLGGKIVKIITPYLDDAETLGTPYPLKQNENKSFQGSIVLGKGFVLEPHEAEALIKKNPKNKDVLFPYLNGDDLNSNPDQSPSRWVINFFDWAEEKARQYPDCYEIIERLVKPERIKMKGDRGAEYWWQFLRTRNELYRTIAPMERVLVVAQVSKTVAFEFTSNDKVLDAKLVVLSFDQSRVFAILQSTLHNSWAWKYCTTMKADMSYTPTAIFETFSFPQSLSQETQSTLGQIGEAYQEHRRQLMLSLQIGLTKTYNLFHKKDLSIADVGKYSKQPIAACEKGYQDILKLRQLHVKIDNAVLECWWRSKSAKSGGGGSLQNGFWTHHSPGDPLEKRRDSPYR